VRHLDLHRRDAIPYSLEYVGQSVAAATARYLGMVGPPAQSLEEISAALSRET